MNVKEVSFLFSWFGVSKNYYTNIIPFCECVCERERERETCFGSWAACVKCGFWPVYMEVYKISNMVVGADLISPKK